MSDRTVVDQAKDILGVRRQAYSATFETPAGKLVLSDLAQFCRAKKSTFDPNSRRSAYLQGRKDVFERIEKYMNLSADELWEMIRREGK
jgi:hypothetical protein